MIKAEMGLDIGGLQKGLDDAKGAIGKFAKQAATVGGPLSEIGGMISGSFAKISQVAAAAMSPLGAAVVGIGAAAAVAGAGMKGMWDAMSRGKELQVLAEQTQMTIPQLLALEKTMGRVGITSEELPGIVAKFADKLNDLGDPASATSKAFASLGLSLADFQGKDAYTAFQTLAKGMDNAKNSTDKMTAAAAAFGTRKGNLLLPALHGDVMARDEKKTAAVGGIFEQSAPMFMQFQRDIGRLGASLTPFFAAMASEIVPALIEFTSKFEDVGPKLIDAGREVGALLKEGADKLIEAFRYLSDHDVFANLAKGLRVALASLSEGGGLKGAIAASKEIEKIKNEEIERKNKEGAPVQQLEPVDVTASKFGLNIAEKASIAPGMIADSLAKVGGGGGVFSSAANDIDIQRDQLRMQTRMATALEAFVQKFQAEPTPYLGMTMDASTAA
jgi:hypothetical protein